MTVLNRIMSVGGILMLGMTVTCKESKKSTPAPAQQRSPAPCTPSNQNVYGNTQGGVNQGGVNQGYSTSNNGTGNSTMLLQNGSSVVSWLQIEPIIQRACASCHGPGSSSGQYSTYETAAKANVVTSVAVRKRMPTSGPLPLQEQQLFTQWQAGGFQRSTSVTPVAGTGSGVTTATNNNTYGTNTTANNGGYNNGGYNNGGYNSGAYNNGTTNCYPPTNTTTPQTYGSPQPGYQTTPNGTQQQGSGTQTGF